MAQQVKPVDPASDEAKAVKREFRERVNMSPSEIEKWLQGDKSRSVGQPNGRGGATTDWTYSLKNRGHDPLK
jgi:hypothetical protein